jgi:alanyl-tRNA synthetase
MIGTRAPEDPYTLDFESTVASVSEPPESETDDELKSNRTEVVLDETYFYAESGGQPADRGAIGGVPVTDVQHRDDAVVHTLTGPLDASEGETISGAIDPEFRTYCMRAHTASHVLYGAGRRLLDDLSYGGFDIGAEKVRVDFETTTEIDSDLLVELERLVNRAVWNSFDVTWEQYPREETLAREDVAFNTKTEEGLGDESVRIVDVDGWDVAACGGTHVHNTREIGPVTVLERSNPGEGLTRVEFAVGPAAIDERATERAAIFDAATAANTRVADLPDAIGRLQADRDAAVRERDALREQAVESQVADLREAAVEKEGETWVVGAIDGLDANELADRAGEVVRSNMDADSDGGGSDADEASGDDGIDEDDGIEGDEPPAVAALVGADGRYLAVASAGEADASAVVERVTSEVGGGGGGSPTVAQGGGLDADPEAVVALLRDEDG